MLALGTTDDQAREGAVPISGAFFSNKNLATDSVVGSVDNSFSQITPAAIRSAPVARRMKSLTTYEAVTELTMSDNPGRFSEMIRVLLNFFYVVPQACQRMVLGGFLLFPFGCGKKKCTRVERSWVSIIDKQIELNDLRPVTWKYLW